MPALRRNMTVLFALLALLAQLVSAAAMPLAMPDGPRPVAAPICGAGTDGGAPAQVPHHHQDCALCPLCLAAHMPLALADAPPLPTLRDAFVVGAARPVPPARAPPAPRLTHAQPRAPPALA